MSERCIDNKIGIATSDITAIWQAAFDALKVANAATQAQLVQDLTAACANGGGEREFDNLINIASSYMQNDATNTFNQARIDAANRQSQLVADVVACCNS